MFLQTVHVLEIPTLYKILNEIKENFSFKISNFEKIEDFLESLKQKKIDLLLLYVITKCFCKILYIAQLTVRIAGCVF